MVCPTVLRPAVLFPPDKPANCLARHCHRVARRHTNTCCVRRRRGVPVHVRPQASSQYSALIDTPLAAKLLSSPDNREAFGARYPLKRIGEPADVAALARFLLSAESGWITGQVFGVDGGMSTLRT